MAACLFVTGDELVRVGLVARKMSINIEMTQECASFFIAAHPVAIAFPCGKGGTDRRSVTDEAANEDARTNLTMEAAA